MTLRTLGPLAFTATLLLAARAQADATAVFPFETVNTAPETAKAIALTIGQHLESRGFTVLWGDTLPKEATVPPTVESRGNEAADEKSEEDAETPAAEAGTAAVTAPSGDTEQLSHEAMSMAAVGAGCRFYLTGSTVQLGEQITITVDLFLADGARIAGKKIVSPSTASLPGAIQTIAYSTADEMKKYASAPAMSDRAESETPRPEPSRKDDGFDRNFGLMLGQTFSISDDMYSFISFYFNGRFEFNRLLMTTNAGFAIGNKDPGDGFHFALNISLSAYLLKTQITPYIGGGFGFFIGNRMADHCEYDEYYGYETCDDQSLVGWDVFPVLGLEVLRTMFMRVHLEGRYLVTFNGYGTWGHGPSINIGIAF